ncbi:MAG TPA: SsrA-binding protein SmpB [Bacilli bacterium]|nr:SsrA-binding protein SmpB [Bacilli bacterium]HPT89172.1 SsrA-binding protein SmpB [Bacilli bacterium]HQD92340.1 SsrA-binding protein SmpB [Bacilli bacterium]
MKKDEKIVIARNKKAHHDYFILETYEFGIVLKGTEIKSIRKHKVSIQDAYCQIKNNELFVINMHIAKYEQGNRFNHEETRTRKLLAHKREIRRLLGRVSQEGLTLIPLEVYIVRGRAKLEVGLAKGKKSYDKREDLKKESAKRQIERALKEKRINQW